MLWPAEARWLPCDCSAPRSVPCPEFQSTQVWPDTSLHLRLHVHPGGRRGEAPGGAWAAEVSGILEGLAEAPFRFKVSVSFGLLRGGTGECLGTRTRGTPRAPCHTPC